MDLDRDARRLLDLAIEARAPAAEDKARLERKLATVLGAGALGLTPAMAAQQASAAQHASAAAASAKAASGTALKWWVSSAILASAVTGYFALSQAPTQPPSSSAPVPAIVPGPMPAPDAPVAPFAPEPAVEPTETPVPSLAARAVPSKKRAAPSDLNEELELLHRAQSAWRAHDARAALALLDDHRARFPRSELKLERDGLRVLTLCELGRKTEAATLAQKLLERAPRSPLRGAIEESCALK